MRTAATEQRFEDAARHRDILAGLESLAREQRVERVEGGRPGRGRRRPRRRRRRRRRPPDPPGHAPGRETHRFEGLGRTTTRPTSSRPSRPATTSVGGTWASQSSRRDPASPGLRGPGDAGGSAHERAGRKVELRVPQRGGKVRLVELARTNARHVLEDRVAGGRRDPRRCRTGPTRSSTTCRSGWGSRSCRASSSASTSRIPGDRGRGVGGGLRERRAPEGALPPHADPRDWGNDDYRSMAEAVDRYLRRRLNEGAPSGADRHGRGEGAALGGPPGAGGARDRGGRGLRAGEAGGGGLPAGPPGPGAHPPAGFVAPTPAADRNEAHRFAGLVQPETAQPKRTIRSELGEIPGSALRGSGPS
jgi:hypothetical protein